MAPHAGCGTAVQWLQEGFSKGAGCTGPFRSAVLMLPYIFTLVALNLPFERSGGACGVCSHQHTQPRYVKAQLT